MSSINPDAIKMLNRVQEPKGEKALRILSNLYPHLNAICNTEVGVEILKDDLQFIEDLMLKILTAASTVQPEEKAQFNYLINHRLPKIYNRLKEFLKVEATCDS